MLNWMTTQVFLMTRLKMIKAKKMPAMRQTMIIAYLETVTNMIAANLRGMRMTNG